MKSIGLIRIITLLAVIAALSLPSSNAAASEIRTTPDSAMLQLTSAGHVLGFDKSGVYMAGPDHTLSVEFMGSRLVSPVAEGCNNTEQSPLPLGKVSYKDAWDNIDIIYTAADGGIAESTYVLHPGANPADIRLRYNTPVEITADGALSFRFQNGSLTESAPIAWQELDGLYTAVDVSFVQQETSQIGFAVNSYDSRYPLYIDPTYIWHTFYGGQGDYASSIALDSHGNIYLAVESYGTWNGPAGQLPRNDFAGMCDIAIVKLDSAGTYQWHTYYGGSGYDQSPSLKLDASGNIYVTGYSFATWNGPTGQSPLHTHSGSDCDIVVMELNNAGGYLWHTFYGSTYFDMANCIGLDSAGNIVVAGSSQTTWNGPTGQLPLHAHSTTQYDTEMVILKLSSAGGYLWHTFYGGTGYDIVNALVMDASNNIYAAGYSGASAGGSIGSTWNGPNGQAPLNSYKGLSDIVVIKLDSAGGYIWHTFYGSAATEAAYGIALDINANIIVCGYSDATWNGPAAQPPLHAFTGGYDAVVMKLSNTGGYIWHTFYGGSGTDYALAIKVSPNGNIIVDGVSNSTWGGPNGQSPQNAYTGDFDIAVFELFSNGGYICHAFYGCTGADQAPGFALNSNRDIFLTGASPAAWNGPSGQAPLNAFNAGAANLFVIRMSSSNVTGNSNNATVNTALGTVSFNISAGGISGLSNTAPVDMRCSTPSGYIFPYGMFSFNITDLRAGQQASVTIRFPNPLPLGTKYYKCINGSMVDCSSLVTRVNEYTLQLSLTDGGLGDADGVANGTIVDPGGPAFPLNTPPSSSSSMPVIPQKPVSLSNITVKSASLSATKVTPGTPVTVTANVANTGTGNGTSVIKIHVNGAEEAQQGVTVNSGSTSQVSFDITRNEPGTYSVYVGGTQAGSFTVDQFTPDTILFISGALVLIALAGGVAWMAWKRQTEY